MKRRWQLCPRKVWIRSKIAVFSTLAVVKIFRELIQSQQILVGKKLSVFYAELNCPKAVFQEEKTYRPFKKSKIGEFVTELFHSYKALNSKTGQNRGSFQGDYTGTGRDSSLALVWLLPMSLYYKVVPSGEPCGVLKDLGSS
ncbi:hypothetical protein Trydic_g117 [Trypoxylus dichotomus]